MDMKKIFAILSIAALAAVSVCAEEALVDSSIGGLNVTVYGDANGRLGMQAMNADNTDMWSSMLMANLSGNGDAFMSFLQSPDMMAAQTKFGTELVTKILTAAQTGGDFSAVSGKEKDLAGKAGFSQTEATAIVNAYMDAIMAGDDAAAAQTAAAGAYQTWAETNAPAMLLSDTSLAGYLNLPDYTSSTLYTGLKNENAVKLGARVSSADGKLTADASAKLSSNGEKPVDIQNAWIRYDFGPIAVTYNSVGGCEHWDTDILYVGDVSLENALDFEIKPIEGLGSLFVTFMSDEAVTSGVRYTNVERRTLPLMQAAYSWSGNIADGLKLSAAAGGALDLYIEKNNDYTGYIAFGKASIEKGAMALQQGAFLAGISGLYGQNTNTLSGMNTGDMEQATLGIYNLSAVLSSGADLVFNAPFATADGDSIVAGGRIYGGVTAWTGGILSADVRYSNVKLYGSSDAYSAQRYTAAVTQFLNQHFNASLGFGYEQYSVHAGNKNHKPADGYEITLDIGFRF